MYVVFAWIAIIWLGIVMADKLVGIFTGATTSIRFSNFIAIVLYVPAFCIAIKFLILGGN